MTNRDLNIAILSIAFAVVASPALAQQGFGDMFTNFRTETLGPAADLVAGGSFVAALIAAVMSVVTFWNHNKHPHDMTNRPMRGIILAGVAAALVAIPEFLGMGVTTFFGSGADTTSIDGTLRSIN